MGTLLQFHANDDSKKSVFVWFTSDRQADLFVETYKYHGGFCRFMIDIWEGNKQRKSTHLKSSKELFDAICMCLNNPQLSWVNYLIYSKGTKTRKEHIAGLDTREDYPERIKVIKFMGENIKST